MAPDFERASRLVGKARLRKPVLDRMVRAIRADLSRMPLDFLRLHPVVTQEPRDHVSDDVAAVSVMFAGNAADGRLWAIGRVVTIWEPNGEPLRWGNILLSVPRAIMLEQRKAALEPIIDPVDMMEFLSEFGVCSVSQPLRSWLNGTQSVAVSI